MIYPEKVIMKVEFKRDLDTLYEVTNQRLKTVSIFRKLYRFGFSLGPLLGILLWKLGVVELEINNNRCTIIEICESIVIGSLIWFFLWLLLCCNFKKIWIKGLYREIAKRDMVNGKGYIELNEDGVIWKGPHTEQFFGWKIFTKIYETNDFFCLEPLSGPFLWVPKNAFQNNEQAIAFLQYANNLFEKNQ